MLRNGGSGPSAAIWSAPPTSCDAANEAAEAEGETCTVTQGKRGEVLLRATLISGGMAKAA